LASGYRKVPRAVIDSRKRSGPDDAAVHYLGIAP
jgi:hypothetical protein